jgi:5'-methylthioinosine phosphorylase
MSLVALIVGSGYQQFDALQIGHSESLITPYGPPSAPLQFGSIFNQAVVILPRHGSAHTIPPHKINYRANLWALKSIQVDAIIALAAVGGITTSMAPASIALPDQIIDYTYDREQTFFSDCDKEVTHIDFTYPYDETLRTQLISAAGQAGVAIAQSATYGCTQGPRLETAAEIRRMENDGCDIVGMTGMPEAALAREINLPYASVAMVANWAAGKTTGIIRMEDIRNYLTSSMTHVNQIINAWAKS